MKRVSVALLFLACIFGVMVGCSPEAPKPSDSSASADGKPEETKEAEPQPAAKVSEQDAAKAQKLAEEAEVVMMDPKLPAGEKYPKALAMFNEALEIDPQNSLASKSKALIEGIYKSMNKPVPGAK